MTIQGKRAAGPRQKLKSWENQVGNGTSEIRKDGFVMRDGEFVDERPVCYVCGEPIDVEMEIIKKTEMVNGKEVVRTTTIEREPLCIGNGLYRHRGSQKANCEPDSTYYMRHLGVTMAPDIKKALEVGHQIKKEKREMATLKPSDKTNGNNDKNDVPNLKERLFEANKKLAQAKKKEEKEEIKKEIEKLVKKSGGTYEVNPTGYAVQVKKSEDGEKKEKKEKEKKEKEKKNPDMLMHTCPDCGTKTKSTFVPGHDGRIKGWFKKVKDGHMKVGELNEDLQKMYKLMDKNPDMSVKEAAETVMHKKQG